MAELLSIANQVRDKSGGGKLDTGYSIASLGMEVPAPVVAPNASAFVDTEVNEVQLIELVGNSSFGGYLAFTFNGESSRSVPVSDLVAGALPGTEAANAVTEALEALPTISSVGVNVTATNATTIPGSSELGTTLAITVAFHYGPLVPAPLNLGPLPLLALELAEATGHTSHNVRTLVRGTAPVNFSFPEHNLELALTPSQLEALQGGFSLNFSDAVTRTLYPNCSASTMRLALMDLPTVGELEVFRSDTPTARSWLVRSTGSDACTDHLTLTHLHHS